MDKSDVFLWYVLAIYGLNFLNIKLGFFAKCFRLFFILSVAISLLYEGLFFIYLFKEKLYKESIFTFLIPANSIIIWYVSYFKRKAFSQIVLKIYRKQKRYVTSIKQIFYMELFLMTFVFMVPLIACVHNQTTSDFTIFELILLTFGYEKKNEIWTRVVVFCMQLSESVLTLSFPFYLMFCMCVLFYRFSEVLSGYKRFLRIQLLATIRGDSCNFANFFDLVNLARNLSMVSSNLSFFIILFALQGFLAIILLSLSQESFKITIDNVFIFIPHVTSCFITIICFTICSSIIPENFKKIQLTVRKFLNKCGFNPLIPKENLFYLMRIDTEEIVYISACGMFHVTRNYILSALGVFLTYGLIVINLKF